MKEYPSEMPEKEEKKKNNAEKKAEKAEKERKKKTDDAMTRISPAVKREGKTEPVKDEQPEEDDSPIIVKDRHNSTIYAMMLTILYLLVVVIVSVGISLYAIDVANDAFALKKSGVDTDVVLTGDYPSVSDLADQLYEQHIIKHPNIFKLYAKLRHKDNVTLIPGKQTATTSMGYDALIALFQQQKAERKTISVTVPEGFTVDDIIDLFLSKGVGTREGFEYVINEAPLDESPFLYNGTTYWFLDGVNMDKGQIYRLEGYLYPETYFIYDSYGDKEGDIEGTAAAKAIVGKMLAEFNKNIKKSYLKKHKEYLQTCYPGIEMTMADIITLASILEKECLPEERSKVSAVFYNRMANPAYENNGGRLESNATTVYVLRHLGIEVSGQFTDKERLYDTPYSTYLYAGLPAGPIVTPTRESINAALYPDSNCDSYYFVGTASGYSFFAATMLEHSNNVERARNGEVADPYVEIEELPEEEYNE